MGLKTTLKKKRWMSYRAAGMTARDAGVKSRAQYIRWHKQAKPLAMPRYPYRVYLEEWKGWNDFLGTNNMWIPVGKKDYWQYHEALKWAHKQGWKTEGDFHKARRENRLHPKMPRWPDVYYKQQWISWPVFLGKAAQDKIQGAKINISVLCLASVADMPGGYISVFTKDTPTELKEYLTSNQQLRPVKVYHWEPEKKALLNNLLSLAGSNYDGDIWRIGNPFAVISELDQHLRWFR